MSKFINGFYAGAIFLLTNGTVFQFKNIGIADEEDHFIIYECNPDDDRQIIYKSNIVRILLHPEDKKKKKAGVTDGQT